MGQVAAIVALATMIGVLIEGQTLGWASPRILAGAAVAVAAGSAFLWIEMRSPHAMLPLKLFKQGVFSRSTVISLVSAFVFYGLFFATSLDFQETRGYSPWQTGLAFLPMTAMVTLASMLSHRIAQACGDTLSMCTAFGFYAVGAIGLWVAGASSTYAPTVVPLLAIGLASGFISPAATAPAMEASTPDVAGVTAATLNAARQTGAAFGVAIFGTLLMAMPSFHAGMRAALWTATGVSLAAALALAIPRCLRIPHK